MVSAVPWERYSLFSRWLEYRNDLGFGHPQFRQCSSRLATALAASFSASRLVAYECGDRTWIRLPSQTVQRYRNTRNGSGSILSERVSFEHDRISEKKSLLGPADGTQTGY